MKFIFIVYYTMMVTFNTPCPDLHKAETYTIDGVMGYSSCAVNHGMTTDTLFREQITSDTNVIKTLLKMDPNAKIDTFILTPFTRNF